RRQAFIKAEEATSEGAEGRGGKGETPIAVLIAPSGSLRPPRLFFSRSSGPLRLAASTRFSILGISGSRSTGTPYSSRYSEQTGPTEATTVRRRPSRNS